MNDSPDRTAITSRALKRFSTNRVALVAAIILVGIALSAAIGPKLLQHDPTAVNLSAYRSPPNSQHWLGTDTAGRDVLARVVFGGRVSLIVGLSAAATASVIALILGSSSGLIGGRFDAIVMRLVDIMLSFPSLIVILGVVAVVGPSPVSLILAIGLFEWPLAARIVRAHTLQLREIGYVTLAFKFGQSWLGVLRRHIVPNVLSQLTVIGTLIVAQAILLEAALSFLGLGIQPPTPSWGNMLNDARSITVLSQMPWLWLPPGVAIIATVLCINLVGDGIRDLLDPRLEDSH